MVKIFSYLPIKTKLRIESVSKKCQEYVGTSLRLSTVFRFKELKVDPSIFGPGEKKIREGVFALFQRMSNRDAGPTRLRTLDLRAMSYTDRDLGDDVLERFGDAFPLLDTLILGSRSGKRKALPSLIRPKLRVFIGDQLSWEDVSVIVSNCPNLKDLDIEDASLKGKAFCNARCSLERLVLGKLTDKDLSWIVNKFPNLRELRFRNRLPSDLSPLRQSSLRVLDINESGRHEVVKFLRSSLAGFPVAGLEELTVRMQTLILPNDKPEQGQAPSEDEKILFLSTILSVSEFRGLRLLNLKDDVPGKIYDSFDGTVFNAVNFPSLEDLLLPCIELHHFTNANFDLPQLKSLLVCLCGNHGPDRDLRLQCVPALLAKFPSLVELRLKSFLADETFFCLLAAWVGLRALSLAFNCQCQCALLRSLEGHSVEQYRCKAYSRFLRKEMEKLGLGCYILGGFSDSPEFRGQIMSDCHNFD